MKTGRFFGLFGALLLAKAFGKPDDNVPMFRGYNYALGGYNPIYITKRTKFKGWMREKRRCTFNKNK